jgi:hypothetical protein
LKKDKDESLEKLRVARYCVTTYESEKEEFKAIIHEEKSQLQREKEKFLVEGAIVKEVMNKSYHFMPGLAQEDQESVKAQTVKLVETIQ